MNVDSRLVRTTAVGAGVGAAGGIGLQVAMGVGLAVTGTALALPAVAAGAVLGGLMGLAYGMGGRSN